MTLPVTLNDFPNPVGGMGADVIAFNVRGQDNILATAVNQIIDVLGGGGFPLSVPASHVTAGTFGASVGGGSYAFSNNNGAADILTIGNNVSGDAGGIRFLTGATHYSWLFAAQFNVGGALEWTPSTAVGGTTFSTPVMTLSQAGALNIVGDLSVATSKFTVDHATGNGVFAGTVTASNLSGTNTGDQTNISGNAATATLAAASTKLATARNINGVSFDGTADITISVSSVAASAVTAGTFGAGNFVFPAKLGIGSGGISPSAWLNINDATGTVAASGEGDVVLISTPVTASAVGDALISCHIKPQFANGGFASTAGVGLYVDFLVSTAADNYAIFTNTGKVRFGDAAIFTSTISAAGLPTAAGASGTLWVDTTGGLNILKRA